MTMTRGVKPRQASLETEAELGEYKGSPTLSIFEVVDGKRKDYPFTFGKKKAQMIVKHLELIKEFAGE